MISAMLNPANTRHYTISRVSMRFTTQFGGSIACGLFLPAAILSLFYPEFLETNSTYHSLIGVGAAQILSIYLMRNLSLYPGMSTASFVLPSVLVSFGMIFALLLLFRLDYSRALLLSSAAATLIWLYAVQLMIERGPQLRLGIVPFGDVESLRGIAKLELCPLTVPVETGRYDLLVADFRADLPDEWETFLADAALAGVPVLHVKQLRESVTGRVEIEHLSENTFGSLIPFKVYLRLRRAFDLVTALFAIVLLMPFFFVVALLIKLDSRGPVLFRQPRVGYRGEIFRVTKFRTMVADRDEQDTLDGAMTKTNDERITRVGKVLRRTRIDELPQVLNILKGEMSWIGPRPEAEVLSRWYEAELPFYRYRHIVPPGITGWAQVNQGHVFELDQVVGKLHYDFYYIKNFSPWLDALIIAKTAQIIITGFGSK